MTPLRAAAAPIALLLAGCAPLLIDEQRQAIDAFAQAHAGAPAQRHADAAARRRALAEVDRLLAQPLDADAAVRIALANSAALQALLARAEAESARATQSARAPNPLFAFERLLSRDGGQTDKEIGRSLSLSLFELLTWPQRSRQAELQQQRIRLQASADVLRSAAEARAAWVRATAARQSLAYFEQVRDAAEAAAELARRMQAVGNWSRLQRAREQAFYADAAVRLARARQADAAAHEALVRALGLDVERAQRLRLPPRLPDLPAVPIDEPALAQRSLDQRLDLKLARAEADALAEARGLQRLGSLIDGTHVAALRNSETGRAAQKGYEIELPLPLFDPGDARRAAAAADVEAARQRAEQVALDAASQLRERYAAYRSAHELARHYRDEVVPLARTIADENLLRYNGMLIGVFELLADARQQIASVLQAIEAEREFWLADAALQAALLGVPGAAAVEPMAAPAPASAGGAAH